MGTILSILPKEIDLPSLGKAFNNAVDAPGSSALYRTAQANYNRALQNLQTTNNLIASKELLQAPYKATYDLWKPAIDANDWRGAYEEILGRLRYKADVMFPGYHTMWPAASMGDYNNDIYTGYSGMGSFQAIQKDIIRQYVEEKGAKSAEFQNSIDSLGVIKVRQQKAVDDAKKEVDRAVELERLASIDRANENLTTPEYIAAQAAADAKRRMSRNVLVLGIGAVLMTGAILIFRNR